MLIVSNGTPIPATISGTGTTFKLFTTQVNLPGSSRLSGQDSIFRWSGSMNAGVNTNVQCLIFANYPATQVTNSLSNITSASMVNNVATYNVNNNFVVGQYVTVANIANANLSGYVGPLISANNTAITANIVNGTVLAIANIANAAQTANVQLAAQPLYVGAVSPTQLLNTNLPFDGEIRLSGDQASAVLFASGSDRTINLNTTGLQVNISTPTGLFNGTQSAASTGLNGVPQVNFKQEPPVYLTVAYTFGSSNANNAMTLESAFLES